MYEVWIAREQSIVFDPCWPRYRMSLPRCRIRFWKSSRCLLLHISQFTWGLLFWPLSWLVCHPCSWMLYQRNPIMFVWDMFTDLWFVVLVVVLGKPRLQHATPMVLHWVVPSSSGVRVGWRPVVCSPPDGHLDSFWYLVFINSMFAQVFVQTWCFHFLLVTTEELDYRVNYTCL